MFTRVNLRYPPHVSGNKWLVDYDDIATHMREAVPREARVLVVGCGNSSLSADMFDDGYR